MDLIRIVDLSSVLPWQRYELCPIPAVDRRRPVDMTRNDQHGQYVVDTPNSNQSHHIDVPPAWPRQIVPKGYWRKSGRREDDLREWFEILLCGIQDQSQNAVGEMEAIEEDVSDVKSGRSSGRRWCDYLTVHHRSVCQITTISST